MKNRPKRGRENLGRIHHQKLINVNATNAQNNLLQKYQAEFNYPNKNIALVKLVTLGLENPKGRPFLGKGAKLAQYRVDIPDSIYLALEEFAEKIGANSWTAALGELLGIGLGQYEDYIDSGRSYDLNKSTSGYFVNPALDESLRRQIIFIKEELLKAVTDLVHSNNSETFELRTELIAYLRALLVFLGDGLQNPPKSIPEAVPRKSKSMAKELGEYKDTAALGANIMKLLETLFSLFK